MRIMSMSFEVSSKLSGKYCFVHNMGISASMSGDAVLVKVCCPYFKEEIEEEIKRNFAAEYAGKKIRLLLPGIALSNSNPTTPLEE